MVEEMKKEFEEKFVERGIAYYCWQTQNSEEVWDWFESKLKSEIAEACKKQREICAKEYRQEEFSLVAKGAIEIPQVDFTNVILNAPSPLDEVK